MKDGVLGLPASNCQRKVWYVVHSTVILLMVQAARMIYDPDTWYDFYTLPTGALLCFLNTNCMILMVETSGGPGGIFPRAAQRYYLICVPRVSSPVCRGSPWLKVENVAVPQLLGASAFWPLG